MLRRSISKYTRETLQFFGQPISYLLREQITLLLIAVAVTESAFSSSVICLPLYFYSLGGTENSAGIIGLPVVLAVYYFVSLSTASFFGYISDKYGRRPLLIVGTAIAGISFIPFPFVFEYYSVLPYGFIILLIANSLKGIAAAMISGPILAIFADLSPEQNHGETMGKFYLARSAGGGSGFLLGGLLWESFIEYSFLFFAAIMFVASALYLFKLHEPKRHKAVEIMVNQENGEIKPLEIEEGLGINPFKTMMESLKDKQFRKFAIAWLAYTTLIGAGGTYAPVILEDVAKGSLSVSMIGFVFLVGVAIIGVIQPTVGKLSDKFGRKPFLILGVVGMSLLIIMFSAILALEPDDLLDLINNPLSFVKSKPLAIVPNFPLYFPHILIILMVLVFLLSAGCFASSSLGLISDVTKEEHRGREMGFTQAIMSTGSILGSIVGGTIFGIGGSLSVLTFCFGLSIIAVVIIIQFLYETSGFYHFTHKLV
ncbi:MAG: MFS transporter [Candidatus Hodarchaeales archaeon]